MSTEIAAAQDFVTNLRADQGNGSHLAPELQRSQLPKVQAVNVLDGKAPLPVVEMAGADVQSVNDLRDPCNFLVEVAKNFKRIDQNRDEVMTAQEIGVFRSRPNMSARQVEMSNVLLNHFKDFTSMGRSAPNGIDSSGIKHLAKVTYPNIEEFNPSFSGTVGRSAASGAAGGAAVAAWNDDKVGEGASEGAVIGAVIGAIAYSVKKADYNQLVRERANVNSWNYFELGKCTVPADATKSAAVSLLKGGTNSDLDSNSLLRSVPRADSELKQLVPLIKSFSDSTFGQIDFDRDGALSKSELAEGLNSGYIPKEQRKFAEILYRNHEQLVGPGSSTMPFYRLGQLAEAADRDVAMANVKSYQKEATLFGGMLGLAATLPGSIILASKLPRLPGVAFGGLALGLVALGAGIGYFATRPSEAKADNRQKSSLRETALAGTLQELRTLNYNSSDAMGSGPAK